MNAFRLWVAVATLMLFGGLVRAADFTIPTQKITGAEAPVPLGELVSLSVTAPSTVPNLVATSYDWKVFDGTKEKSFARDSDGKVFFGAGLQPKTLLAVVAITHLYTVQDAGQVKQVATRTVVLTTPVTIGESAPPTNPPVVPPTPVTPPATDTDPVFPAGKYQLSQFVYQAAKTKVPAAARSQAQAVANAFSSVASQIQSGSLKTETAILAATAKANDLALGSAAQQWADFSESLGERLEQLSTSSQLKTPADYQQAWVEISSALSKVK